MTQSLKNHEDWWHKDNSAPADLFGRQALAYCRPSHLCACSHSQLHHVGLKWKHESYPEFMSVKEEKKMTLPFHPSQGWWSGEGGGTVNLKGEGEGGWAEADALVSISVGQLGRERGTSQILILTTFKVRDSHSG